MQFNDTTNKQGLVQDVLFKTGTGLSQYTIANITRNMNEWYNTVFMWIISADGRWKFDDANQTDQPVATTDLVSGQENYKVLIGSPSASQDWLEVTRVEILDENDLASQLQPYDNQDIEGMAVTEFQDVAGQPRYFDFDGSSIFLKPASNYNKTAGMTIYFNRTPLKFAATDTTKRPGFASTFHRVLSLGATYDWQIVKDPKAAEQTMRDILVMKADIQSFYSGRPKYERPKISRKRRSYK